jgi:putative peptidoglycan lipid II flippase
MVAKILKFLNLEINGLHKAAYILGVSAVLSQILALFRDRLLAGTFGASKTLDIYYASFRVPDFIFVSLGSLVSVGVIIPMLIDRLNRDGDGAEVSSQMSEAGKAFVSNLLSAFMLLILSVSVAMFFLLPYCVSFLFPGFSPDALRETILLGRILLLSPILLGVSNLFSSIVQVHNRFYIYALSPILYNVGIIIGIVGLYPMFGDVGLVWGVVLGALAHMMVQVPFMIAEGYTPTFSLRLNWKEIGQVFTTSLPRTVTLSTQMIALMVITTFASKMTEGSIATFNFSYNLQSVPLSIIGVSYAVAAFPLLSRMYTSGDREKFIEHFSTALRHIIFWTVPSMVLFIVLRAQIIRIILGSGKFSWDNTRLTAAALALFAFSLVAQNLLLLFVRGYYAAGNTRKPLFINSISAALTLAATWFFVHLFYTSLFFRIFIEHLFKVDGIPGTEILMLPLAFSIGALANLILLWVFFRIDFPKLGRRALGTLFHSFAASVIMGGVSYLVLNILAPHLNLNTFSGVLVQGLLAGLGGILVGMLILQLLKNSEFKEMAKVFQERFWYKIWKVKIVGEEQREL